MTQSQIALRMQPAKTYYGYMNLGDVKKYLDSQGVELPTVQMYICPAVTKPYDELTSDNTYVSSGQLSNLIDPKIFREMECVVVTNLTEKPFVPVKK